MTVTASAGAAPIGARPAKRPARPEFSTGPTAKPPSWTSEKLIEKFHPGRSHRSAPCKAQLRGIIDRSAALLNLPNGWVCGLVPGSDTGAVELALWALLSDVRGVDVLSFESFSATWAKDVQDHLKIKNAKVISADYGELPDVSQINFDRDLVFAWNGTTSGVCFAGGDFIPNDRRGLVICDATSAAFAVDLPFDKLDVVTWSWQKSLGGEGGHGMIALSPKAQARLADDPSPRPLPKIFRLTKGTALNASIFQGATINTPSMLAAADHEIGLDWAEGIGGLKALRARVDANAKAVAAYVNNSPRWEFLANSVEIRSKTALCLKCVEPTFLAMPEGEQRAVLKRLEARLADECVAYDIGGYRDAPPGLRLWGGPTVDAKDLETLMPWIDWAFEQEMTHA